ncbi:MAG: redoxin domain-containing protein [Acidobacteria bacterium]|nr:redoxin domain-containing protein [Acidobacteriota bacterium]MBM3776540.1 redoxin domain-containing protein [Acidobacteriota bacterium]
MTGYQAGIQKFGEMETQVIGVSTDNLPSIKYWTDNVIKTEFPIASDFMRKTATAYGVLMPERGIANRATFVVDKEGKIAYIEEGSSAVDTSGAANACSRLKKH